MRLLNITPIMTSLTTPTPYVVSASSAIDGGRSGWVAFGADSTTTTWHSSSGKSQWIQLDFGTVTKINAFSLMSTDNVNGMPSAFILYGSNDNSNFTKISEYTGQTLWALLKLRLFVLPEAANYRYYRITTSNDNGYGYIIIGKIRFYVDLDGAILSKPAEVTMSQLLTGNTTNNIKQKSGDNREGLLGFANDSDNYATIYMVGNDGKAKLIKAGLSNLELLFSGTLKKLQTGALTNNYSEYKLLLVKIVELSSNQSRYVPVPIKTLTSSSLFMESIVWNEPSNTASAGIWFKFPTTTSIYIGSNYVDGWISDIAITEVYGIR